MTLIIIVIFTLCWSGLVWASAVGLGRGRQVDWPGWWAAHIAAAVVPVGALVALGFLPPVLPDMGAIVLPADLSFLQGGAGDGLENSGTGPSAWSGIAPVARAIGLGLYAGVAALLLARLIHGRLILGRIVRRATPVFLSRSGVPVLVTDAPVTPFAMGGVSALVMGRTAPVIIVPAGLIEASGDEAVQAVIEHEASHIARRDPDLSTLFTLAGIALWPSPFITLLIRRWRLSAELQCDRAALNGAAPAARKRYARTLLAAFRLTAGIDNAGNKSATGKALPCPPAAFSTSQLKDEKMRMIHIMQGKDTDGKRAGAGARSRATLWLAAGAFLVAGTASALLADGQVRAAMIGNTGAGNTGMGNTVIVTGGEISSAFGMRPDPLDRARTNNHRGVDVKAAMGAPVHAPAAGIVLDVTEAYRDNAKYGKVIVLQTRGGVTTAFAHLGSFAVGKGDRVTEGQKIAEIGMTGQSTGPHVHIETYIDGELSDPASVWPDLGK